MPVAATDALLAAVLDGLSDHVCVIDGAAQLVAVNEAWLRFARNNGGQGPAEARLALGSNYLAVCDAAAAASGADAEVAAAFAQQLRAVLAGDGDGFMLPYRCDSPDEPRWFVAKVARLQGLAETRVVVAHDNVSALHRAQREVESAHAALQASEQHLRTLFDTLPLGLVCQDRDGVITDANPAAQQLLGLRLDEITGRPTADPRWQAVHPDGRLLEDHEHPSMVALRTGQPVRHQRMGVTVPAQGRRWLNVHSTPLQRPGQALSVVSALEDVTQRVADEEELQRLASTDPLTGLLNRRRFLERLTEEHARFQRVPERPYGLLMLDLDHFKRINDGHGHAVGDAVLRHVAQVMLHTLRRADVVGRVGGEEFAILLPDTPPAEAAALAERLRLALAHQPLPAHLPPLTLTASLGLDTVRPADLSHEALLLRADHALYAAKQAGRNRCEVAPRA